MFFLKAMQKRAFIRFGNLTFKFNFGFIGWPPQPLRERVPKINQGIFDDPLHIERPGYVGHFGASVHGNIKLSKKCKMMPLRLSRSLRLQRLQGLENH